MTRDNDPEQVEKAKELGSPLGGVLPEPRRYTPDEEADPDLERWQRDRWAPHSQEPELGRVGLDPNDHTPKTEQIVNPDRLTAQDPEVPAQPVHENDWAVPAKDPVEGSAGTKGHNVKPKAAPKRRRKG